MGVVNVTPDSFSDGGRFLERDAAVAHALQLAREGADILDIGGESTRPGAEPVAAYDEIGRIVPVIEAVRRESDVPISVDTFKPEVAQAAVEAGANIWNDITALRASEHSLHMAARLGCGVVLMHMQGEPRTMQQNPRYDDVVAEVRDFLAERAEAAMAAGVAMEAICVDPGIGFGKTVDHNLALIANLHEIVALGYPVVLGASRKRFIQALDTTAAEPTDRLAGSLAAGFAASDAGAAILRVHDVRETVQALAVREAIAGARVPAEKA